MVGLELYSNALGLTLMFRGITSLVGSPVSLTFMEAFFILRKIYLDIGCNKGYYNKFYYTVYNKWYKFGNKCLDAFLSDVDESFS